MLRLWYHAEARQRGQSEHRCGADGARRSTKWSSGFDSEAARYEAQRCLSCGNCFECDGCYWRRARKTAVMKLGPGKRYAYDLDTCTGCAICYDQCPCGAITMVLEQGRAGSDRLVRVTGETRHGAHDEDARRQ